MFFVKYLALNSKNHYNGIKRKRTDFEKNTIGALRRLFTDVKVPKQEQSKTPAITRLTYGSNVALRCF